MEVPKKKRLKIDLPYNPAIPLLGIYLNKTIIQKDTCTSMFIAALVTIAKIWNQSKCPLTGEWINKRCCAVLIYIYMYIYIHTHTLE